MKKNQNSNDRNKKFSVELPESILDQLHLLSTEYNYSKKFIMTFIMKDIKSHVESMNSFLLNESLVEERLSDKR
jgi:hypothetical protein